MNPVSWFEVPVSDMQRAITFYNAVFGWDLKPIEVGELTMAWFPMNDKEYGAGGSLCLNDFYQPMDNGVLVYFMCDDVADALDNVRGAGGTVLQEKKLINEETGYMGLAYDSEGNRIAFHSTK